MPTEVIYKFKLTGDYLVKLAEMANGENVIDFNPLTATKAEFACYQMHQMMESSSQIDTLSKTINTLSGTVTALNDKVSDLERAANAKDVEILELKSEIVDANIKITNQTQDIKHLLKRADQTDVNILELERHSRSSNLRIGNLPEKPNEDCKEVVNAAISQVGLDPIDIENVHRVGEKKEGKTRFMIVRFVRRTERREVLSKRKDFFDKNFPLYEDLPKQDLLVKQKFAKEIKDHHNRRDRCYFSRGAWYVNNIKKYW